MTVDGVRMALRERVGRGPTLHDLDTLVQRTRDVGGSRRAALWSEAQRRAPREATVRRVEGVRSALSRLRQT